MARLQGGGGKKRQKLRREKRENIREKQELQELENQNEKLQLTEFVSVSELASLMDTPVTDVIMTCMNLGVIVSINQRLDAEIIELVAEEFNHEVEFISVTEEADEEVGKSIVERTDYTTMNGPDDTIPITPAGSVNGADAPSEKESPTTVAIALDIEPTEWHVALVAPIDFCQ